MNIFGASRLLVNILGVNISVLINNDEVMAVFSNLEKKENEKKKEDPLRVRLSFKVSVFCRPITAQDFQNKTGNDVR